jgi:hypothetical protein
MSALSLVKDTRNPELVKIINKGGYNLSQLEKDFRVSIYRLKKDYGAKSTRRGRPKKAAIVIPEAPKPTAPEAPKSSPNPVDKPLIEFANAGVIALAGLALGGVGLSLNIQYWYAFGGMTFGVLGAAIDCWTIFLPANLNWRRLSHIPYCALWLLCFGLSSIAALGFAANNIGDSLQGRETIAQHRKELNSELAGLQTERLNINENRDPQVLEERIQIERGRVPTARLISSKDCTDVTSSGPVCAELNQLRASKRTAERRIELDGRLRKLSEEIAALPAIAAKDPGAEHISKITAGWVGADWIENFRVLGFAFMPSLAGFLLAFARTLLPNASKSAFPE